MDADERATLNYDCNYNLFLAKRLIRDVRKSQERNSAVEWLRYLMGANKSIGEMQLRNDFLHYLVQNLQEGSLRPPFDVPPSTGGPLANIAHLIPSRKDYTMNLDESLSDESSSVENHHEKPLVMDLSPDGGEFLALQPIPREGSFCYLAIIIDLLMVLHFVAFRAFPWHFVVASVQNRGRYRGISYVVERGIAVSATICRCIYYKYIQV